MHRWAHAQVGACEGEDMQMRTGGNMHTRASAQVGTGEDMHERAKTQSKSFTASARVGPQGGLPCTPQHCAAKSRAVSRRWIARHGFVALIPACAMPAVSLARSFAFRCCAHGMQVHAMFCAGFCGRNFLVSAVGTKGRQLHLLCIYTARSDSTAVN